MRFIIYNLNYAPDVVGIAKYTTEMAEWLVAQGHEVRVIAAPPYYPAWRVTRGYCSFCFRKEKINGVTVYRCPLWVPRKPTGLKRIIHLLSFSMTSFPLIVSQIFFRPDVVMVIEPPVFCAPAAWMVARLSRALAWLHVQDFEIDAAIKLGLFPKRLRKIVLCIEKNIFRHFDYISTISENMLKKLVNKDVDKNKAIFFPNWVDLQQVYPLQEKSNSFRDELNLSENIKVVLYSGSMGAKQGLELVIDAARKLQPNPQIQFVLCGEGPARLTLIELAKDLNNVTFLPLQPLERLNELLNLADIHLLPQVGDASDLVMPSKLTGMLASGRPIVTTTKTASQIAYVVQNCGIVVQPGDCDSLVNALLKLANNPVLRVQLGRQARAYAEEHLSRDKILQHVMSVVKNRVNHETT